MNTTPAEALCEHEHGPFRWEQLTDGAKNSYVKRAAAVIAHARPQIEAEVDAERQKYHAALVAINNVRNSIIGRQSVNWSMHIYHLVAVLDSAGFVGDGYEVAKQKAAAEIKALTDKIAAEARASMVEQCATIAETPFTGEQDDITMQAKDRVAKAIRALAALPPTHQVVPVKFMDALHTLRKDFYDYQEGRPEMPFQTIRLEIISILEQFDKLKLAASKGDA